ncbi:hypothetical protein SPRG_17768 [Saprolegnia parasitica CBS 223.65]|uniref:RING-type domain-containing protein n=1 Tax=Saprolegnia parasitica (strain CBS 223.65) TaxID=695850 RepID=A0A067BR12_SAPPC|nr:hypothetical protein SPRG_17768 [Saprolegnia parasitica CBS 223.65]KDO16741.1 hypothetical protein SPRG_17768 [Saprolegnia parasitica CBS 223.65]|eukprot:XP_012212551.1 hypothetical protein SPRG_17768 [Saprolegnia parasitica CBS 223.65]
MEPEQEPTTCAICLDDVATIRGVCGDEATCSGALCIACLRAYVASKLASAIAGVLTKLHCPLCVRPVNMCLFRRRCSDDTTRGLLYELNERVKTACYVRCPGCDENTCLLPEIDDTLYETHIALSGTPANLVLADDVMAYVEHKLSVQELYARMLAANASVDTILRKIGDSERAGLLFTHWMRHYVCSAMTSCCERDVCFLCQAEYDSEHYCDVNEYDTDMAQCPSCMVFLVKGDGCDAITCFCGEHFNWPAQVEWTQLHLRVQNLLAAKSLKRALTTFAKHCVYRRRFQTTVVPAIGPLVLAQRLAAISSTIGASPSWTMTLAAGIVRWRRRRYMARLPDYVMTWRHDLARRRWSSEIVSRLPAFVASRRVERISERLASPAMTRFRKAMLRVILRRRLCRLVASKKASLLDRAAKKTEIALPTHGVVLPVMQRALTC